MSSVIASGYVSRESPPAEDGGLRYWLDSIAPNGNGSFPSRGYMPQNVWPERGPGERHTVVPRAASEGRLPKGELGSPTNP